MFGKRGVSSRITVAFWRSEGMMSFEHVFQTCTQDSAILLSIMKDVIGKLKLIFPGLQYVSYR